MKQHVYKGNGRPTFVPPDINAHYVDLETGEVYLARGDISPSDWGEALLDITALQQALDEFEQSIGNGVGLNQVIDFSVQLVGQTKLVYIDIENVIGKFVRITDPTDTEGNYEIILRYPEGTPLRRGTQFTLFNETSVEPTISHETDNLIISGSMPVTSGIQKNGVVTVKYYVDRGQTRYWVVYGDTTRNLSGSVPLAQNASMLDGRSFNDVVAQIKATLDDGLATDAEVSTVLQELASSIDQASNLINPPA